MKGGRKHEVPSNEDDQQVESTVAEADGQLYRAREFLVITATPERHLRWGTRFRPYGSAQRWPCSTSLRICFFSNESVSNRGRLTDDEEEGEKDRGGGRQAQQEVEERRKTNRLEGHDRSVYDHLGDDLGGRCVESELAVLDEERASADGGRDLWKSEG